MAESQQFFKAGESQGQARGQTDQWIESAKDSANTARDKTAGAAQSAQDCAQHGKDQSAGFLQQTGDQVKCMAQGAVENVKSTLGVGDHSHKK